MQLNGLHHVTAITAQAARNVAFYTRVLGLRLVKKTVNQDDVSAYHLFYADALGSPGTDLTFFDWPQTGQNRNGTGSIAQVALRAPGREALNWWAGWLRQQGVEHAGVVEEDGQSRILFRDPEGLDLALVDDRGAPGGVPWERSPVPPDVAIRGLHGVTLMVSSLAPLARVLTQVLGFELAGEHLIGDDPRRQVSVFTMASGGPGMEVHVESGAHLMPGRQGSGGVHHVAFRVPGAAEQLAWRERIAQSGLQVTPVIDRFYFQSIYFRVPGSILFEIATDGPGFAADEDVHHLGERLALPPFLEPHRQQIEAGLHPLETG
jgi:glyoxalase family protein